MEKTPKTTPFSEIIKEKKYLCEIFPYSNGDCSFLSIPKQHMFSHNFPSFFAFINNCDEEFGKYILNSRGDKKINLDIAARAFMRQELDNYEAEIRSFIGKDWENLRKNTKVHTTLFLALAHLQIGNYDKYTQNILYWTILYHDIGKHQVLNPNYKEVFVDQGVDKMHPFKSTIIFLSTFLLNNYIFFSSDKEEEKKERETFLLKFELFSKTLFKSFTSKASSKSNNAQKNLSYEYIDEIESFLLFLREKPENRWIYDITVLVLFHQSLPNNDDHMNKPLLDEKYITLFFDLRLIEMMRFVMVYDSSSHALFKGGVWVKEINKHINKLRLLYK